MSKRAQKENGIARETKKLRAKENIAIIRRLDDAVPLNTAEWQKVEQLLMQVLEFAPSDLVFETATAIAFYADDQARRGYILGAQDSQEKVA